MLPTAPVVSTTGQGVPSGYVVAESWKGPLPHPTALAAYNDALPGGAERVVAMAEREQAHRHSQDVSQVRLAYFTRSLFVLLALVVLAVAILLVIKGQTLAGLVALVGSLGSFALIFIWGGRQAAAG